MSIDWHALGTVFAVTLAATVGLVGVFTLGVVGLSKQSAALTRGGAVLCFAACAAAVGYGIDLIVA
jgi:hypothetical protein